VAPGGVLSVVLQLPSEMEAPVGSDARNSIQALRATFHLVDPASLGKQIEGRGFRFVRSVRHPLPSGKAFWMGLFERLPEQG